jgi:hypothetical protein
MRLKLHVLALASILVIGGVAATSGPTSAGDGFARYLQQQARDRKQARLHEQARSKNRSSTPKSAGAHSTASTGSSSARPGTRSSPSTR